MTVSRFFIVRCDETLFDYIVHGKTSQRSINLHLLNQKITQDIFKIFKIQKIVTTKLTMFIELKSHHNVSISFKRVEVLFTLIYNYKHFTFPKYTNCFKRLRIVNLLRCFNFFKLLVRSFVRLCYFRRLRKRSKNRKEEEKYNKAIFS